MYGWRGRIGLMRPTGNSVMEPEFNRISPEGVSVHANRIFLKDVTPESLLAMEREVEQSARGLAGIRIGVLAFGCTSGSFVCRVLNPCKGVKGAVSFAASQCSPFPPQAIGHRPF